MRAGTRRRRRFTILRFLFPAQLGFAGLTTEIVDSSNRNAK
jgi:hypothetical protein